MDRLRAGDPEQVGAYRLLGRLGGGGMGQVFLGRSRGGRPVAVKLVRPELADDARFRERFAAEVAAARRVGGFYTAQVVDADPYADPPWLVTAYVPGPSLEQAIQAHGALPSATVCVLGAGLAEGLAAIHECGLVHRDLKPGNVILAEDGPRVIDFGIARVLDATHYTSSIIGTPPFMSPEQTRGLEIGPASDVFSFGSVLVYASTGRTPFGAGPTDPLIYRIRHDPPDLTGLPTQLTDLIASCLAKDPAERPSLTTILDHLAAPHIANRWLPPAITTVIAERGAEAYALLTPSHDPTDDADRHHTLDRALRGPAGSTTSTAAKPTTDAGQAKTAETIEFDSREAFEVATRTATPSKADTTSTIKAGPSPLARVPRHHRPRVFWASVLLAVIALLLTQGLTQGLGGSSTHLRLRPTQHDWHPSTVITKAAGDVNSIAFSSDSKTIASGSEDWTVRLWNATTGAPIGQPLTGHTDFVRSVAFSPDGKTIASGSWDGTIRVWRIT